MPDRLREWQVALRAVSRPSDVDGRRAKWRTVGRHGPAGAGGWQRGRLTPRGGDRGEAPVRGARGGPRRLAVEGGDTPCAREGASGRGGWGGRGRGHSSTAPPPTRRPSRRARCISRGERAISAVSRLVADSVSIGCTLPPLSLSLPPAVSRLHLGCILAVSQLYLSCISAPLESTPRGCRRRQACAQSPAP